MKPLLPRKSLTRLGAALACSAALVASAGSDIDLFAGVSLVSAQKPNVLVILDSSANWNASLTANSCQASGIPANALSESPTMFAAEMCALHKVVGGLQDNIRLGLMMMAETGNNGGYVRYAMRDMTAQNKTAFQNMVAQFRRQGSGTDNSGANQPYGKIMFEAFKYFGGFTSPANALTNTPGSPQDATHFGPTAFAGGFSNVAGSHRRDTAVKNSNPKTCQGLPTAATGDRCATLYGADNNFAFLDPIGNNYNMPISVGGCEKNFIIFISNGNPSVGGDSGSPDAPTLLANVGGNAAQIMSGGSAVHASSMDEWARFLRQTDVNAAPGQQKVTTYTIAVYPPGAPNTSDQAMISLMKSAAAAGGGKYFAAQSADAVLQAILTILNEVQAVNSVFVSASLPVSVNTQGTFLNQVYMGMFRPDASGQPRWLGNLKQYEFIFDAGTGDLFLGDATGKRAVNPATGFITPAAESFWTSANTFWANSPTGTPASASDLPDGEVVEKGGASEKLRTTYATSQATRRIYTCPPGPAGCSPGPLSTTFDNASVFGAGVQAAFGVATAAELTSVVNWIRGEDNVNGTPCNPLVAPCTWTSAESGPGWTTTVRPSTHGDVLHSRPVVLNYSALGPYIFYGANDGLLHAVKGGQNQATDGVEVWAFMPPEFFTSLVIPGNHNKYTRLRSGVPALKLPSTPPGILPAPQEKDYFFDGPIGSYQDFAANKAWIFVAARRGGRVIYALDVSDPVNPVFMWRKTQADLPFLGQTWSEPKAIIVKGVTDPVLIFGGGYDPTEDLAFPGATTMGNRVYILNAKTGAVVREFTSTENGGALMKSIPSDIATVDVDFDGFTDNAYVGDMGGKVYRLDLDNTNPALWKMYTLADLSLGPPRKFFFQPDIVLGLAERTIVIGSGDREKPLVDTTTDRFFGLRDTVMTKDVPAPPPLLVPILESELVSGTAGPKGWYLGLLAGEKVVNSPLTIAGVTYFSTNQPQPPAPGTCAANLGIARAYALDFTSGTAGIDRNGDGLKNSSDLFVPLTGGGLPPSPVGGIVELDDGRKVGFIIGSGEGGSSIEGARVRITVPMVRRKVYWNAKTDK